jgi:hypothetical protein
MYSYENSVCTHIKIFIRINVSTKCGEGNERIMSWAPRKKCKALRTETAAGSKQSHYLGPRKILHTPNKTVESSDT